MNRFLALGYVSTLVALSAAACSGGTNEGGHAGTGGKAGAGGATSAPSSSQPSHADSGSGNGSSSCHPKFASGLNVAWVNYARDIPNPTLAAFEQLFQNTYNAGGRVAQWWFHVNGASTPGYQADGTAAALSAATIADVKSILDAAHANHVMVTVSLWSFDMLQGTESLPANTLANNYALLTQDANRQAYIDNVVTPLVTALKGHPGLYAWSVFNEPEGMTNQFGWTNAADGGLGLRVDESVIQKNVNWIANAIHTADPGVLVTVGSWLFKATGAAADAGQMKNYYSDAALVAAGGKAKGTLDFYQVHYYDNWSGASVYSPFLYPKSHWNLDKPVVIGEFWPVDTDGVHAADLYTTLYSKGYDGAWAWQYANADNPGPDASTMWPAEKVPMENLFTAHSADLMCPGDPSHVGPDASVTCTSSIGELTDGGGRLLYGFDEGLITGWGASSEDPADAGLLATLGDTLADGHACGGALTATVPFPAYSSSEKVNIQVSVPSGDWTGRTKLHIWAKLETTSYGSILGVQGYVQANSWAEYTAQFTSASVYSDGGWHEIVIDLANLANDSYTNVPTGQAMALAAVNGVGVQVAAAASAPSGGPSTPPSATLLVDDLWVE